MSIGSVKRKRTWRCLKIGNWNVLSLHVHGARNILKQGVVKVNMDLMALQKIRWLGNCILEKKNV